MSMLVSMSLSEAARALRKGEVSARELADACLDRIGALDDSVHAFLAITPELAQEQADEADRVITEWKRDQSGDLPTLLGIPIAVKDVLCVEGVPTTCGSKILEGFRPPYSATSVSRIVEQGAVVIGKTNTDEFAMGSSTENSAFGTTHNPWNLERVPGGSSGGSAAAVAAHMCYAALGTDTGGSVRQPASFCGVTGIKPSYGRVSRYGLIAYGSSLDTVGALARSTEDLLPLYHAIAGPDPLDSTSLNAPPSLPNLKQRDLGGVVIGVPEEYFIEGIQPEVERAILDAVDVFRSLGARVQEVSLPHTDLALPVYYIIAPAEASANLARYDAVRYGPRIESQELWEQYLSTRGDKFGSEVKRRIMLGTYALSAGYYDAYYGQAQKVRTLIKSDFEQAFETVDLIACPVAPTTAFKIGEHTGDPVSMYLEDVFTLPANLAGIPGIAFPVGFDRAGLPIGMQLNAPHMGETTLLEAAHLYQTETDWHRRFPDAMPLEG